MSEHSRGRRFPLTLDAVVERKPVERQRETRGEGRGSNLRSGGICGCELQHLPHELLRCGHSDLPFTRVHCLS